jgi:hypothetical protein
MSSTVEHKTITQSPDPEALYAISHFVTAS